jgi:hypothetical protein
MITALIFSGYYLALHQSYVCLKQEQLKIPETPAVISWGPKRADQISILIPVDCASKKILVPKNRDQYLKFLDLSIPINLKSGAVQGCGSRATNRAVYTVYNYNADWVVLEHLAEIWKNSPACKNIVNISKGARKVDCAEHFYEVYRANFMPRNPFIIGKDPAQIPTEKELDDAAINDPKCIK